MLRIEKTKAHQRYKTLDGKTVPGASTIAKVAGAYNSQGTLIAWANKEGLEGRDCKNVSREAMDIGTIAHFLTDRYIDKQLYDLSNCAPDDVAQAETACIKFGCWYDEQKFVSVANEEQMVSSELRYGGTLDNVLRRPDGELILIDKKTSKGIYPEGFYQLAGLARLWIERHPDMPLQQIGIVRLGKKEDMGDFEVRMVSSWQQYFKVFKAGLDLYWALQEAK